MKQNKSKRYVSITIDVEDWFQVENLRAVYDHTSWEKAESRVERNTELILEALDNHKVKATFFILGWVAERYPKLVKKISEEGHEVASHGYNHILNYNLSEEELRRDLESSKKLLEDLTGKEVIGYRAPSFSVNDKVLATLSEIGYRYDSSFNPFSLHDRYGTITQSVISRPFLHQSGIVEFPMPVLELGHINLPISGGGYFRIYPFWTFKKLLQLYFRKNTLFVFYMHPWEIDSEQPVVKNIPFGYKLRHYVGLKGCYRKFEKLLTLVSSEGIEDKQIMLEHVTLASYLVNLHPSIMTQM